MFAAISKIVVVEDHIAANPYLETIVRISSERARESKELTLQIHSHSQMPVVARLHESAHQHQL